MITTFDNILLLNPLRDGSTSTLSPYMFDTFQVNFIITFLTTSLLCPAMPCLVVSLALHLANSDRTTSLHHLSHITKTTMVTRRARHHFTNTTTISVLLWGSKVWWTNAQLVLTRIQSWYHRITKIMTGLPRGAWIQTLLHEAGIPPWTSYLTRANYNMTYNSSWSQIPTIAKLALSHSSQHQVTPINHATSSEGWHSSGPIRWWPEAGGCKQSETTRRNRPRNLNRRRGPYSTGTQNLGQNYHHHHFYTIDEQAMASRPAQVTAARDQRR